MFVCKLYPSTLKLDKIDFFNNNSFYVNLRMKNLRFSRIIPQPQ